MQQIVFATRQILKIPEYLALCVITSFVFFVLFIVIPVFTIPGNSLAFQLSIFREQDYVLMAFLAMLVGLNVALQWCSFQQRKAQQDISKSVAQGVSSGVLGVFGAVVGTAACASCLAFLFGLIGLGTGSVFFVLKNQSYFLLVAIALMIIMLYFAARKINKVCTSC